MNDLNEYLWRLRIPMRGYETLTSLRQYVEGLVTNPHAGL